MVDAVKVPMLPRRAQLSIIVHSSFAAEDELQILDTFFQHKTISKKTIIPKRRFVFLLVFAASVVELGEWDPPRKLGKIATVIFQILFTFSRHFCFILN